MKDYHLRMARLNWLFFCRVRNSQVKVCKKYICWKIRKLYPCEAWWVYYIFYCTIRHSSRHCNNCKQPCSNCSSFPFHWVKGGGGEGRECTCCCGSGCALKYVLRIWHVSSLKNKGLSIFTHNFCKIHFYSLGIVQVRINNWVLLSFCLPHKAHQIHSRGLIIEPETIDKCLSKLRPYHGILLLVSYLICVHNAVDIISWCRVWIIAALVKNW